MREVEVKSHVRDEETAQTIVEMKVFLETLGITRQDIGAKRYDVQLLLKQYDGI